MTYKLAKKPNARINMFCVFCFAITALIIIIPMYNNAQLSGHDVPYHTVRIEALKQQIIDGHPFSRINYFFNQGEGYASSLCYPDLLLYIPALFRVMGIDINISYNIFMMLLGISCYGTAFYSMYKITSDKLSATICAILLTLCQYHLDNLFTRAAIGEIQAFIFIPLVIYGLYDYLYNGFSHPAVMAIGFIGLMLSHTITTFLAVLTYIIVLLFNIPKIIKAPKNLIKLGITASIVLLCTAYYWIPLIEIMAKMDLSVKHPAEFIGVSGIPLQYLFANVTLENVYNFSTNKEGFIAGIGFSLFLLLLLRPFIKTSELKNDTKKHNLLRCADMFAISGIVATILATNLIPWNLLEKTILNSIQFAWRIYIIASVFLSFASALYIYLFFVAKSRSKKLIYLVVASIFCLLSIAHIIVIYPHYVLRSPTYFTDTHENSLIYNSTWQFGNAEWLPYITKSNKQLAYSQSNIVKDKNGNTYDYIRDGTTIIVGINSDDAKTVQVPLIYYIGYTAEYMDSDGHITNLKVQGTDDCGLCEVNIPNKQGTLKVYYKGTALQKISFAITLITIATLIAYAVIIKNKNKEIKRND